MLTITDDAGITRYLGNVEPPAGLMKAWPKFGDTPEAKVIPRSEWDALIQPGPDDPFLPYVHDQDGIGQCNCDATAALVEYARAIQGLDFVKLSAADMYARINGGSDNGSTLEDALAEMLEHGIGTAATAGTLWRRGQKLASDAERARFKALEVYLCPTFDHCFSAVLQGFGLVSGVWWGSGYRVEPDGWLNVSQMGSRGGHAVLGYKPAKRGSTYGIWHQNSWTPGWGLQGRCVFPESLYHLGGVGGWWALRSVVDEGGVVPSL